MTNISKQKREKMILFLEKIKKQHNDDESIIALNEIEKVLTDKKYGLVWEKHTERVDEEMKTKIPVFIEDKDMEIISDKSLPYNFILEGDNIHSLKLLEKTHKGKIDVIYIDPPYNTGNKDFIYDDKIVDSQDTFKHSKWISFMNERLNIAKKLLSKDGIIFISIDDNELSNLILLCNEIFGEQNFVACLPTIMNLKGNQDEYGFAGTHEYTLVFCNQKQSKIMGMFDVDEEEVLDSWSMDEIGYYKKGANLKSTGVNAPRNKRPNLFFPLYVNEKLELRIEKPKEEKWIQVYPITDGKEMSWRWSKEKFKNQINDVIINYNSNNDTYTFNKKQRPQLGEIPTKKPKSFMYKPEYSSGNGTAQIKKIFGYKVFSNPKPIELIKDLIKISSIKKEYTVLDFFAGSGTTAQAVMELNLEDKGNRKFILCTNNENNICKNITYHRCKVAITGKREDGSQYSDGLSANLKYYKTDFIDRYPKDETLTDLTVQYTKEMIQLENAINIDDRNMLVFDEEDAKRITNQNLINRQKLYISSNVLLSNEQKIILKDKEIAVFDIPDYYFNFELKEVGE